MGFNDRVVMIDSQKLDLQRRFFLSRMLDKEVAQLTKTDYLLLLDQHRGGAKRMSTYPSPEICQVRVAMLLESTYADEPLLKHPLDFTTLAQVAVFKHDLKNYKLFPRGKRPCK